jgi:hypothetical protein
VYGLKMGPQRGSVKIYLLTSMAYVIRKSCTHKNVPALKSIRCVTYQRRSTNKKRLLTGTYRNSLLSDIRWTVGNDPNPKSKRGAWGANPKYVESTKKQGPVEPQVLKAICNQRVIKALWRVSHGEAMKK